MKRSRISPISKRRRGNLDTRADVRTNVYKRDGYLCRAFHLVPDVQCAGPLDVHEIIPRSAWAAGWLVEDNCLTICRRHHDWIGDHPQAAHELGLHAFSWERSA